MTTPRSLANQKLYHARILAASWRNELSVEQVPASILAQAFDQPARHHLRQAYGWFLLEIIQTKSLPDTPPASCGDLPDIAPGKALPGEIRELQQLEQTGWISELMDDPSDLPEAGTSANNLVVTSKPPSSPDQIDAWIVSLQDTFDRMADSLDEY